MTLKIEVFIPTETVEAGVASQYLDQTLGAIGYVRNDPSWKVVVAHRKAAENHLAENQGPGPNVEPEAPAPEAAPAFRERNRPGDGRARRTKEEIAEDKELDDLATKLGVSDERVDQMLAKHGHAATIETLKESGLAAEDLARNISASPENRVNPEDEAQDKADEAAEVEAARDTENPLTVDDLRSVMGKYVEAHGMPATQEDGPAIFKSALGNPPAGEESWKLSLVAAQGQETLRKAVDAWRALVESGKRYGS